MFRKKLQMVFWLGKFGGGMRGEFRALHDQRLAAGPRQGHFVLDPGKMRAHFPRMEGSVRGNFVRRLDFPGNEGIFWEMSTRMGVDDDYCAAAELQDA